jgi:hypothetical protein
MRSVASAVRSFRLGNAACKDKDAWDLATQTDSDRRGPATRTDSDRRLGQTTDSLEIRPGLGPAHTLPPSRHVEAWIAGGRRPAAGRPAAGELIQAGGAGQAVPVAAPVAGAA